MSECKCKDPYTYGQSLAQQARDHGGLLAVAPMMGMDECMRCYAESINGKKPISNLSKTELSKRLGAIIHD